jgi:hypothetical protein
MLTGDEFISFCQETEARGNRMSTLPLWDPGKWVTMESAPGRDPLRSAIITDRQHNLLAGTTRWKRAADEQNKRTGPAGK